MGASGVGAALFAIDCRAVAGWAGATAWAGVPTVDFPTKMAPASMARDLALMSPMTSALALSSTRSAAVMLPWTLP